jgi:putative oxidoreductase
MSRPAPLIATVSQQQFAIALLRIITGIVFTAHGAQKVFVYGFAGITAGFVKMGVPMPAVTAPFIGMLELVAGIALIIGLLTRLAALGLACDMLGAILLVHGAAGFFLPTGYEFVLMLLTASATLVLGGPGALSVDGILASRRDATYLAR